MLETTTLWPALIDGAPVRESGGGTFAVTDPATGIDIAQVVAADEALVDLAVASARRAFESGWRDRPPQERAEMLREIAARIRSEADELVELETSEVGKPRPISMDDVDAGQRWFDFYARQIERLHGEWRDNGPVESLTVHEPYGVVAGILPFNWPPDHFSRKAAPALAAGNTVVMKPAEQAPLTALRLAAIANEILPPGVLNAVTGLEAGPALVANRSVERISFTGSSATGRHVLAAAARNVTFTTLELGGKNALILLDDADLDAAADLAVPGAFFNQGEACSSTSRILVHESILDDFLARFTPKVLRLVVGDGHDDATDLGPLVDARQRDTVLRYLDIAVSEGAKVHAQGRIPDDPRLAGGYWVAPTILVDVAPDSTAGQEEIFGPVVCVMTFASDEAAVAIANGTQFGLTAGVCSADEARAMAVATRLEAGVVFVNNYLRDAPGVPFGGVKASGFGRESTGETIRSYVRAKTIQRPTGRGPLPVWPSRD